MSENQVLGPAYYVGQITIVAVFSLLASVTVILRFWARRIQKMALDLNDYLIVPGLLCALGNSAVYIYECSFGVAKEISPGSIEKTIIFSLKAQFIGPFVWVASVTFIRASIIFLYIRVFPTRIFRKICYLVLAINICFFVGTVFADCLICQPLSYRWDRMTGGSGFCGHQKSLDLFIGIFNCILDVTAVVLPMPVLWGLKMAVGKKVMLSGMFGMGTAICALTLYRIYKTTTITTSNAQHAYAIIGLLACFETLFGIINACLPVLKPIFNKVRATAPKSGKSPGVKEMIKSGTIVICMRMSQMWTPNSRMGKYPSSDDEILLEIPEWYGEKKKSGKFGAESGKEASKTTKQISPPVTQKTERLMGIKPQEIHVKRDVDVESGESG